MSKSISTGSAEADVVKPRVRATAEAANLYLGWSMGGRPLAVYVLRNI